MIDERPRERFVVLRKLDPESVAGTHYTEGLDLELEDVIDFTDPEGSHPWIESLVARARDPAKAVTSPKILRRDGLTYREVTGDKRGSSFSYRLQFRHPGDLYLMELEYPDNANRVMSVSISTKVEHVWSNSQTGVGVETGGKFHTSGTIQKLRWIHAADSGPHSVDIVNQRSGWPAAARSLRIYHITGELPSVGAGNRRAYGIHSERCTPNSGVGMCFGIDGLQAQQRTEDEAEALSLVRRLLRDLFFMKEACENYARYLLFSGQNVHLMGCIQYTPINTPFVPVDPNTRSPRIPNCMRSMLAHVLDLNGIDIIAGVEYSNPGHFRTWANNAQVAKGSDTYWMVDRQGRQRYGRILTQPGNWQHSQFEVGYQRILRDIVRTFGHLAHFRGVSSFSGPSWHPFNYWFPAYGVGRKPEDWERPIVYSYDYITFASFETETGVDLGVDPLDPVRFARRARALEEDPVLRRQFLDWRCRKLRDFIARSVSVLNEGGGRFELFHFFFEETEPFYRYLLDSGRDMADVMRDFAIDLDLIGEIPNVVINRPTISWREQWREFPSQNPYHWMAKEHDAVLSGFRDLPRRSVICRSSWDECYQVAPGHVGRRAACNLVESDWIIDSYRTRVHIQPAGYHAREALLQAIITTDPEIVFNGYTDLSLNLGNEQVLREVMVPYTRLPYRRFEVVLKTGLEANLAIRKLSVADTSWFYVANPGYWRVKGSISLESGGPVFDVVTGERVSEGGMTALPISLDPFGLLAFKVPSPRLEIVSYETGRITDREIAHMMDIIEIVEDLMADPSTPKLAELPAYTPGEKAFMRETASEAREAIANREYA
ncbi:MAG: hypothetical protein QGI83_12505, partial [Candidatus Latescibacteria bacterium]|nr:hypothetical protein [Candidatus Latescibacterota bacterium]